MAPPKPVHTHSTLIRYCLSYVTTLAFLYQHKAHGPSICCDLHEGRVSQSYVSFLSAILGLHLHIDLANGVNSYAIVRYDRQLSPLANSGIPQVILYYTHFNQLNSDCTFLGMPVYRFTRLKWAEQRSR